MTFVDQIKGIGKKLGIDVTGSNVADALRSLEAGVSAKAVPAVKPIAEKPAEQPVAKRGRRERAVGKTEE